MNTLFPSFRSRQSRVFQIDWQAVGAALMFGFLFALLGYAYSTPFTNPNPYIFAACAGFFAIQISFSILTGWIETRLANRYQAFLTTLDFHELKRLAEGLETDEESREFMIAELTRRQPGWSYA
jgi:hypothetical protein